MGLFDLGEKRFFSQIAVVFHGPVVTLDLLDVVADADLFHFLKKDIEIEIETAGFAGGGGSMGPAQGVVKADQVVDASGEFDGVIDPAPLFRAQFGHQPFVRKGFPREVVVPGVSEKKVVLKEIDMGQDVVEDHHVEPVRVVVIIKRDGRPGVDDGFVRIVGIEFVFALFLHHLHVVHPVVVEGGDHHFWGELQKIPVGNDVFQGFVLEAQTGLAGALFAPFHDTFGMLVDEFHGPLPRLRKSGCESPE